MVNHSHSLSVALDKVDQLLGFIQFLKNCEKFIINNISIIIIYKCIYCRIYSFIISQSKFQKIRSIYFFISIDYNLAIVSQLLNLNFERVQKRFPFLLDFVYVFVQKVYMFRYVFKKIKINLLHALSSQIKFL